MSELQVRAVRLVDTFPYMMKVFHRIGTRAVRFPNITPPQYHTLSALSVQSQCTVSELAHFIGIKSPAASEIIDRLVKDGWVQRTINPNNRRETFLKLSTKGKAFMKRLRVDMISSYVEILKLMTPREQSTFEHSILNMAKIAAVLEKRELKK